MVGAPIRSGEKQGFKVKHRTQTHQLAACSQREYDPPRTICCCEESKVRGLVVPGVGFETKKKGAS